ncbi:hypothetical protein [Streptomyces niger]|uniref:hypothetical protein n=1 Tax=Streptomyces niger TaxID=66373 RepID=UPI0006993F16|nr:hypothetical protein [Streptomyces niger]
MSTTYALDFTEDPADGWIAVPILEGRGAGRQRRKWAKKYAELHCALLVDGVRDKTQEKELARVLAGISEQYPQRIPMQFLFAYAPDLRRQLVPFFCYATASQGPVDQVLDTLVQRDEPGAVQGPEIVDFTTDNLGKGRRSVRRFVPSGGESLGISVNYGWRVDPYGIDLSLRTVSDDIEWVSANIDAFDAFARNLKVVHPDDVTAD